MIILALMLASATVEIDRGGAQDVPPRLSVAEWRQQDEKTRQTMIVAAVEGLMLAASGPKGDQSRVDRDCLGKGDMDEIVKGLESPEMPDAMLISTAVLEVTKCSK